MGRPKRVRFDTFHEYDKLHTHKEKMISGVEMTALYPIKETKLFYQSIEVWASLCSKFRRKKEGFTLEVNIPVITDQRTIDFLDKHCWKDWADKERADDSDTKETLALLDKLFPDKKKYYFYEIETIFYGYAWGNFLEGADPKQAKYINGKYNYFPMDTDELKTAYENYKNFEGDKDEKSALFSIYYDLAHEHTYTHHNKNDIFIQIGQNGVCYPVAFSKGTAQWSIEKYGKEIAYARAGEILFVVTPDAVYFQTKRHF